jgi:NAD(P)-dependent dehydrogenase (short-subunit alcohol dehydrogenase family)
MKAGKELEGKVAFITGAGSGIGKAAALLFAKQGAKIAALGRTEDELRADGR